MVHQYKLNGYNIVLDICSGAVHVVDDICYDIIEMFEKAIGSKVLCNKVYSGTEVIKVYGEEHLKTKKPIVYTSADSVFQIATHEDIIPVETLYEYCETARKLLTDDLSVGRVIARPFVGDAPNFKRTAKRRDFSLKPPKDTMLDALKNGGFDVIGVGKISDIFEYPVAIAAIIAL